MLLDKTWSRISKDQSARARMLSGDGTVLWGWSSIQIWLLPAPTDAIPTNSHTSHVVPATCVHTCVESTSAAPETTPSHRVPRAPSCLPALFRMCSTASKLGTHLTCLKMIVLKIERKAGFPFFIFLFFFYKKVPSPIWACKELCKNDALFLPCFQL